MRFHARLPRLGLLRPEDPVRVILGPVPPLFAAASALASRRRFHREREAPARDERLREGAVASSAVTPWWSQTISLPASTLSSMGISKATVLPPWASAEPSSASASATSSELKVRGSSRRSS